MLHDLVVVDVDSVAQARALEARFPVLLTVPRESTRKGMHYYFRRSEACARDGHYDGPAQVEAGIDFKSICRTGTGGVVVCAPSTDKAWLTGLQPSAAACGDIPDVRACGRGRQERCAAKTHSASPAHPPPRPPARSRLARRAQDLLRAVSAPLHTTTDADLVFEDGEELTVLACRWLRAAQVCDAQLQARRL